MKRFLQSGKKNFNVINDEHAICVSDGDDHDDEPAKKKTRTQKFRLEYSSIWPYIKPSKIDNSSAYCEICSLDFKISHGGRDDCRRHVESKRHKDLLKATEGNQSVKRFFVNPVPAYTESELAVTKAETMLVKILADYNLPISAADRFTSDLKSMFPDSAIANKFKCGRSKSTAVIKEMATMCKETLYSRMKSSPFTISTDGSNDKGSSKQFPLIVRTVDTTSKTEKYVTSEILSIPTIEGSATGRRIFELIAEEFESHKIPWSNCLSLGCDNANVMVGKDKGVFGCMAEKHRNIFLSGCICHLLHIAAEKGASMLPIRADELLIDAYYYLDKSSLRQHSLKEFQMLYDVKQQKILKHVNTRWLSLANCIDRILENWQPLAALVERDLSAHKTKSQPSKDDNHTEKSATKEKISSQLATHTSESSKKKESSSAKSTFLSAIAHSSQTTDSSFKKTSQHKSSSASSSKSSGSSKSSVSSSKSSASSASKSTSAKEPQVKWSSKPIDRLQRMDATFKSPVKKLYLLFLQSALPVFIKVNVELQEEAPQIHLVRRKMVKLLRTLFTRFLVPCALSGKEMTDVQFSAKENQSPVKDLLIGDLTTDYLHACLIDKTITVSEANTFYCDVVKFFENSCAYLIKKIPFADPLLKHIEILDPALQKDIDPASLRYFLDRFPILHKDISREEIMAEFSTYKSLDIGSLTRSTIDSTWKNMLLLKDEEGAQLFTHLPRIMLFLATIPHSSAHCERIFSCVRQTHTDQRASLGNETIEALMIVKANGDKLNLEDGQLKRLKSCYSQSLKK